jgi:hypothetical protein
VWQFLHYCINHVREIFISEHFFDIPTEATNNPPDRAITTGTKQQVATRASKVPNLPVVLAIEERSIAAVEQFA